MNMQLEKQHLVDKSELVKLPDDFKPPTILTGKEIKK